MKIEDYNGVWLTWCAIQFEFSVLQCVQSCVHQFIRNIFARRDIAATFALRAVDDFESMLYTSTRILLDCYRFDLELKFSNDEDNRVQHVALLINSHSY